MSDQAPPRRNKKRSNNRRTVHYAAPDSAQTPSNQPPQAEPQNVPHHPSNADGQKDEAPLQPLNENKSSATRTSMLHGANDNIMASTSAQEATSGRRTSIADAISSIAKQSAIHTDDKILRRESAVGLEPESSTLVVDGATANGNNTHDPEPATNDEQQASEENQDHVQPVEHSKDMNEGPDQHHQDDAQPQADTNFEQKIIDNKLTIDNPNPPRTNRDVIPTVSPHSKEGTSASEDNKSKGGESLGARLPSIDDKLDQLSQNQQDPGSPESDDDPQTLIEGKRKSELQEYVPDIDINDDKPQLSEFEPEKDQLEPLETAELKQYTVNEIEDEQTIEASRHLASESSEQTEEAHQDTETNEGPASKEDQIPGDESLPEEDPENRHAPENSTGLPWENAASQEPLPWEQPQAPNLIDSHESRESLPLSSRENIFEEEEDHSFVEEFRQQTQNLHIDENSEAEEDQQTQSFLVGEEPQTKGAQENETGSADAFFQSLPSNQPNEASNGSSQGLPWEQPNKDPAAQPPQDLFDDEVNDDFFTHVQSKEPISSSGRENPLESKSISKEDNFKAGTPDDLFGDDDNDFLEEIATNNIAQTSSEPRNNHETNAILDLDDKLAALNLDDDLLLDDDFLEDEPVVQPIQAESVRTTSKSYLPQTSSNNHYAAPVPPSSTLKQDLDSAKKKSDFYDFPETLMVKKVRPAPRNPTTKYSAPQPSTDSSTRLPNPPSLPPKGTFNGAAQSSDSHVATRTSSKPSSSQSSFFGELSIPTKTKAKPARAAAATVVKPVNPVQLQAQVPAAPTPPSNNAAPVNPYMPTKPLVSNSSTSQYAPSAAPMRPPIPSGPQGYVPGSNQGTPIDSSMPPPRSQYAPNPQAMQPPPPANLPPPQGNLQPFPSVPIQSGQQNGRRLSSASPINTNVPRVQGANSANSPYVPNAGPYAPSQYQKTHSRASSLVGVKGKDLNPYAPALPTVESTQNLKENFAVQQNGPLPPTGNRVRGFSNAARANIYSKSQPAPKILNPQALNQRQFPIFNWSNSGKVVYLIPTVPVNSYAQEIGALNVKQAGDVLADKNAYMNFPGPLNKLRTKKKDVEKWLEDNIQQYAGDSSKLNENLLNQVLLQLLKNDGNVRSDEFAKGVCSVLNPNINYYSESIPEAPGSLSVGANAYRLDNSGITHVFSLIQSGHIEEALQFSLSRGDWAISLVIANFSGPEKFAKIASDYARSTFPFQKSNNKVHHLMPLILKVFAGNIQSVIEDLEAVQVEGDYANAHWREIVSSVIISESIHSSLFLVEFGKFLKSRLNAEGSEICFTLSGLSLSHVAQGNGVFFSMLGSAMHTEVYEYISTLAPNTNLPPTGHAHLLALKLKHASTLADYGLFNESQKYVDTINSTIKAIGSKSPFVNQNMIQELHNLYIRITESSFNESGWFSGKISKVNLDKVWGQLDKFIGGDEPKPKSGDNGVFSKFSPSVSRNASTLDFTALNSHHMTGQGSIHLNAYPAPNPVNVPASDISMASASGAAQARADARGSVSHPPPLMSLNSSGIIPKYAPVQPVQSKPYVSSSPLPADRSYDFPQTSKYAPSNASSSNLALDNTDGPLAIPKKSSSKYSPVASNATNTGYSYANPAAHISSSSINSPAQPTTSSFGNVSNFAKRPSVASVMTNESFVNPEALRAHNHSPSAQSDISMDYPSEFKSSPRKPLNDFNHSQSTKFGIAKELESAANAPTAESPESEIREELASSVAEPEEPSETAEINGQAEPSTAAPPPPPPIVPKKSKPVRANPYAPGASATKGTSRKNRYGPPSGSTANKYAVPENFNSTSADQAPKAQDIDMFSLGGYISSNPNSVSEEKKDQTNPILKNSEAEVSAPPRMDEPKATPPIPVEQPKEKSVHHQHHESIDLPPSASAFTPSPPNLTKRVPHLDDSFDMGDISGSSDLNIPRPTQLFGGIAPAQSLSPNPRESMFNPYQDKNTSMGGFSEFPIPGSPDSTTRANSVVGGPAGLFSSRLSQSHQSALYQQYEVQDDTVRDYVPVVEEEDEDEDADAAEEKRKKEEEDRKARLAADKARQKVNEANKKAANPSRFLGWLGRNDGKPKPIRAKLGEKVNPFYYDEKHKRWLDRTKPIEDQLKSAAPPPPPTMKKKPAAPGGPSAPSAPSAPGAPSAPNVSGPPSSTPSTPGTSAPPGAPPIGGTAPAPSKNLASAGLDDLLSLGGNPGGARAKGKRNARRGYVNVMDQK